MKKIKSTLLGLMLIASVVHAAKDIDNLMNMGMDDRFSFDDVFDNAQAQIERVETELKQALSAMPEPSMRQTIIGAKNDTPTIKHDDEQVYVSIQLANVDDEKMLMKKVEDNKGSHLLVQVPQENRTVEMIITKETLTVSTEHEMKEEKVSDEEQAAFATFGVSRMIQSLPSEVSLQEPKAEYDQDKEMLTITLKKTNVPKSQVIPIKKK